MVRNSILTKEDLLFFHLLNNRKYEEEIIVPYIMTLMEPDIIIKKMELHIYNVKGIQTNL